MLFGTFLGTILLLSRTLEAANDIIKMITPEKSVGKICDFQDT
jgi:hypothetical protein